MVREVYGAHLSVQEKSRLKKMIRPRSLQSPHPAEDRRRVDRFPSGGCF